jgi:hypothetical protein
MLAKPAIVGGNILIGSDGGDVTLLDSDGFRITDFALADDKVRAPLMVSGDSVYVRSLKEVITAFIVSDDGIDKDWEYQLEGF